jgi:hypothetical protein
MGTFYPTFDITLQLLLYTNVMLVIGYKFFPKTPETSIKRELNRNAGEKEVRKTLIPSALLRGTELPSCRCFISPGANARFIGQAALGFLAQRPF